MSVYQVGKPYISGRTNWPERAEYNYRSGSHELRMFLNRLTSSEINAINKGPCEFALYIEQDIIFFLYRFGNAVPWSDAPYSWHLVRAAERQLPEAAEISEPHDLLNIILVEANTGVIKGLRVVTFSPAFTAVIRLAIRQQAEQPWPGTHVYDRQLTDVYQRYPRTTDMLKQAKIRTKGGD